MLNSLYLKLNPACTVIFVSLKAVSREAVMLCKQSPLVALRHVDVAKHVDRMTIAFNCQDGNEDFKVTIVEQTSIKHPRTRTSRDNDNNEC